MEDLMGRAEGKITVDAYPADRARLNMLAAQLTADGPGRFGQAEAIRWLLDQREALAAALEQMGQSA
jgi:hypothetical protein